MSLREGDASSIYMMPLELEPVLERFLKPDYEQKKEARTREE